MKFLWWYPVIGSYQFCLHSVSLQWRHNERLKSPASRLLTRSSIQGADQRKHQSPVSLAFVRGIHRWPVNSPDKGPVTRKMFPFDDVIMIPVPFVMYTKSIQATRAQHMRYIHSIGNYPRTNCIWNTCTIHIKPKQIIFEIPINLWLWTLIRTHVDQLQGLPFTWGHHDMKTPCALLAFVRVFLWPIEGQLYAALMFCS